MCGESYQYEVTDYLGEGGSGRVYKAFRYSLSGKSKEEVALKFLKTEKSIQELIAEYAAIQRLSSAYVVKVYGVESIDGKPTLVMENIEGLTWSRLFCEELSQTEKSYLLFELRCAILSLESEVSFHGDVSPQNIMIDKKGRLRLIDFGNHFSNNKLEFASPEFIAPDVSNGKHHGAMTDFQVIEKIQQKYQIQDTQFAKEDITSRLSSIISDRLSESTQKIVKEPTASTCFIPYLAFASLFLLFIPIQAKPPVHLTKQIAVEVNIVSQTWKRVRINGKDYGFTPIRTNLKSDRLFIEWEGNGKKGRISKLIDSDRLHLSDTDFNPPNALQKRSRQSF